MVVFDGLVGDYLLKRSEPQLELLPVQTFGLGERVIAIKIINILIVFVPLSLAAQEPRLPLVYPAVVRLPHAPLLLLVQLV